MDISDFIAKGKNEDLLDAIRQHPSMADGKTEQGVSYLQFAAYVGNKDAISILKKYKKKTDIFEAACTGDLLTLLAELERAPDKINDYSSDGFTILGLACFFKHRDIVKMLISRGADTRKASDNSFHVAPVHSATAASDEYTAELLIKNGADVNARQMGAVTALHSAAHKGDIQMMTLLIHAGADVNAKMDTGQTPLVMAEEGDFSEAASLLKKYGAK